MRLRLVTWNINSLRKRLDLLQQVVATVSPDVVCLQETKVPDELFPHDAIEMMGFPHRVACGMKSYNGVAILSKLPFEASGARDWCDKTDARHVHATLAGGIELHNFYVPAGGDDPDPDLNPKFAHKLRFLQEMAAWGKELERDGSRRILVGDLNVAPLETDVWSHVQLLRIVSHTPIEVEHMARVQAAHDWVDAMRVFVPADEKLYSWWSYRARDWRAANRGRRLDHIWVSEALKPALSGMTVLEEVRGWELPSDHAPVMVDLEV